MVVQTIKKLVLYHLEESIGVEEIHVEEKMEVQLVHPGVLLVHSRVLLVHLVIAPSQDLEHPTEFSSLHSFFLLLTSNHALN